MNRGNQITFANVDVSLYRDFSLQVAFASGGGARYIPDYGQNLIMELSYHRGTAWVFADILGACSQYVSKKML
jgi:radical SAM superfamily enzyme with C-terminal helix-hairpin-helix motif